MESFSNESELPTLKWGIVGCGNISASFVSDLVLPRVHPEAKHIVKAIGSSSIDKASDFAARCCSKEQPHLYATYEGVYTDEEVDIVYIGTPHAYHCKNSVDAMRNGKHVLCEKPLAMNADEAKLMATVAQENSVYFMEALWTRFLPVTRHLLRLVHEDKVLGDITRVFVDFAKFRPQDLLEKPNPGGGSFMDIGSYPLTLGKLILDPHLGDASTVPAVVVSQSFRYTSDVMTSIILRYPSDGRQGILTCSLVSSTEPEFMRVEGTNGTIVVYGEGASKPVGLKIKYYETSKKPEQYDYSCMPGMGLYHEADAVAQDIRAGKLESPIMPVQESIFLTELMDDIKRQGSQCQ